MTATVTIWGRRTSFNVQKVLWTLDELELAYKHRNAGGSYGGLDNPEFLAMNPHGLVPVLRDEEGAVWESNSIVRYLCAKHSSGNLWMEDPFQRSLADRSPSRTTSLLSEYTGSIRRTIWKASILDTLK